MKDKIKCGVRGYEDIEFEVGQQWKTRGGEVVEITAVYNDPFKGYPIEVGRLSYTIRGKHYNYLETTVDLVTLVKK